MVVTDCGIAINPRRQDLIAAYQNSGLPICTIEALRDEAYRIAGKPDPVEFEDEVVAVVESRTAPFWMLSERSGNEGRGG